MMFKPLLLLCALSSALALLSPAASAAEEGVDELTIYGQDQSQIKGSVIADTVGIETQSKIEKSELKAGLETAESQIDREESKIEKPKLDETKRDKPDFTPENEYRVEWKLILLMGLLEAEGK